MFLITGIGGLIFEISWEEPCDPKSIIIGGLFKLLTRVSERLKLLSSIL